MFAQVCNEKKEILSACVKREKGHESFLPLQGHIKIMTEILPAID